MLNIYNQRLKSYLFLRSFIISTLGLFFIIIEGYAQFTPIEYEEYDLDNGMHVILHRNNSTPIVAVSVLYHVGSKNEKKDRTGFAHFFEHLLFEGSKNVKRGEFDKYITKAGGANNAYTNNDITFYYEILPSNQLALGLWLESERMLHSVIDEVGVETQREVVKEEKRQRVDNRPYGSIFEEIYKRAYKVHPYQWTTIGSLEHLNEATIEEFREFYNVFYVPENATLSIAGDIDIEEAKTLIDKYFSTIPNGGNKVPRPTVIEPPQTEEIRDIIYDNIQLPAVIQAYHIPSQTDRDSYALDMLSQILSSGQSSRLYKKLVDDEQKALQTGAFSSSSEDPGLYIVYAIANSGVEADVLEALLEEEIKKMQTELISEREFQKTRNNIERIFVQGSVNSMRSIAEALAIYHVQYGNTSLINTEINRYMEVTREDIRRVANLYLRPSNSVVLYYLPKVESESNSELK